MVGKEALYRSKNIRLKYKGTKHVRSKIEIGKWESQTLYSIYNCKERKNKKGRKIKA